MHEEEDAFFHLHASSKTTTSIFTKQDVRLIPKKLLAEFSFGSHWSNITPTLYDAQTKLHTLSSTNGPIKKVCTHLK
jgi:hypothetical protein